ncbi:DUF5829 family protein [Limnofasciculus baicalensis]|uniref:DUF5829 family protein n=1 Tax=Limnofasciculus baicalensis BBK-W-15 TaxID=2699891 RepID=A0AAE3GS27_9CYAN|nr:DUF5829 family protein [Limnofasciculus baicalensis]MCP2729484.1 DUF5829 family protein [Limnofasciculus baicalensis BBK-W-15]
MGIEFNHLYVTLDTETLESIAKSEFISQEFCTITRDTVETDTESWTGTYLRGKHSYLELFSPGGAEGLREGFSGIAFNSQQAGQIDIVKDFFRSLFGSKEILSDLRVRQTEDGKVPWFHYLSINPVEREAFASWLMEFHQDYLKYKNIKLTSAGYFNRAAYLKNLDTSEASLFDDISEVHLELTLAEQEELALLLQAFGYDSSCVGDVTTYHSHGFIIQVSQKVAPRYRIRKVVCTLKDKPHQERTFMFGKNAQLNVGNSFAIWEFG